MKKKIETVLAVEVTGRPQDIPIKWRGFILQNLSVINTVFFREKSADGIDCTTENGFSVKPGETLDGLYTAEKLSVVSEGGPADIRILLIELE